MARDWLWLYAVNPGLPLLRLQASGQGAQGVRGLGIRDPNGGKGRSNIEGIAWASEELMAKDGGGSGRPITQVLEQVNDGEGFAGALGPWMCI